MKITIEKCSCRNPWCGCYRIETPEWNYSIKRKEVTAIFKLRDKAVKTKKKIQTQVYKFNGLYNAQFFPNGTFVIGCTEFYKPIIKAVEKAWKKFFNLK